MPHDKELESVRKVSRVLDDYFVDPILGFVIPGVGDLIGSSLGLYSVAYALRKKVSPVIITRMLMNLTVDTIVGVVPFVGDLFDAGWKANKKNLALLSERSHHDHHATWRDWVIVGAAFLVFAATVALVVYAGVSLWRLLFSHG
ncbi:MAG: DUF4112 domain-containing protein [Kofleriaceae bacterium]|nr:DUF4112 domain-containing protein [Kofleriaceae bacterium]